MMPLIKTPKKIEGARIKLLTLPYAGGSSNAFMPWMRRLPEGVELNILELPGRDFFSDELLISELDFLLTELLEQFSSYDETPWVFFGYSNGAAIGFEFARRLQAQGDSRLKHLFVAAKSAPHLSLQKFGHLPDEQLCEWLRGYGNTPEELLSNPEFRNPFFRLLRADLSIVENFDFDAHTKLDIPLTVLHGSHDPTNDLDGMLAWQELVTQDICFHQFDDGHFFIQQHTKELLNIVSQHL